MSFTIPQVGDGATYGVGSDRYAATVVAVSASGKTITIQDDIATPAEGHEYYGQQVYDYQPDPNAPKRTFRWSARWQRYRSMNCSLYVGRRQYYRDPSF